MKDVVDRLRTDFKDPEYRHVYDEGFLNSSIATQIKVLREERNWTQAVLADKAGMNQSRVSELEDVNFNSWTIRTLRKFAKAFDLRLKISFEEFGTLLHDFRNLNRAGLSRRSFDSDPEFSGTANATHSPIIGDASRLDVGVITVMVHPSEWLEDKNIPVHFAQVLACNQSFRKGPERALEMNTNKYYALSGGDKLPSDLESIHGRTVSASAS
jgi:transcriptional regulator with XRE-family HTH domain